jgi:uncharacterized membrane protein
MDAVVLAAFAGASFGALAVCVRWGLRRAADPEVGALVAATLGTAASVIAAAPSAAQGLDFGELWPFFAAGLIAPGVSQIFLTRAVRDAGPSRAAIVMGSAPLMAILIALTLLGEPFRPLLLVGTFLIVLGGVALAGERTKTAQYRVHGVALAPLGGPRPAPAAARRGDHLAACSSGADPRLPGAGAPRPPTDVPAAGSAGICTSRPRPRTRLRHAPRGV